MGKYLESNQTFVNPYNFVSIESNPPKRGKRVKGKFTGFIECELKPLTPIFIPNTSNDKTFSTVDDEIKSYDFYSYNNLKNQKDPKPPKPVIPGSEIRGVIRNIYETITNSCLSSIDEEKILYKRTPKPAMPGIVSFEQNQWIIKPCDRKKIKKNNVNIQNFKEGERISLNSLNLGQGIGYFHHGESFINKKYESIFVPNGKDPIKIDEKTVENLIKNYKVYKEDNPQRDSKHNQYKKVGEMTINRIRNEGALVYYSILNLGNKRLIYLSPACIGREVFYNNLKSLIGKHSPCDKKEELCPACQVFGFANKEDSISSKVRFTDAQLSNDNIKLEELYSKEPIVVKEQASPKLTATEFYLKKPLNIKLGLWNYDYALSFENNQYQVQIDYKPEIKGRKFYWHHNNFKDLNLIKVEKGTKRNVCIRPLINPECKFDFKVYFNNLTENELKNLIWSLNFGARKDNAHKIGLGKPLGLGSVKINVIKVKIRKLENSNEKVIYKFEDYQLDNNFIPETKEEILNELLIITNYKEAPTNISYPLNENSDKTFEWFVANRSIKSTGTKPVINQVLPEIKKDQKIKKYKFINNNQKY
ncbi:MAG: TIGR03986 family CRISPR-associated RAMP protein [candidate division WOR-3 bacterium]